jgi:hypothetical protein
LGLLSAEQRTTPKYFPEQRSNSQKMSRHSRRRKERPES